MPSRHRAAASRPVTALSPKVTMPASGGRSPEMRPNRLVLPAPFGPTIPTVSPAPTVKLRSSAMTTWPKRFVTWSSSRMGLVMPTAFHAYRVLDLGEGGLQVAGDLGVRLQRVIDDHG